VYGVLVHPPSDLKPTRRTASSSNNRARQIQHDERYRAEFCRLNSWYTALLIILSCCFPFSLTGCVGTLVNGAGAGTLVAFPNTVMFGTVPINQTVITTVSLLNGGSAPVQITQLKLKGQSFSVVGPSNLPVNIAVGGTYSLNIQFNPAAAGPAMGQLAIASNSSTADSSVITLSGTGTTGLGSAALGTLSCSSGTLTGSGTDLCTLALTAPAPGDGLTVNLASNNSSVAVPSTVTVPSNATSASFMANVASVKTAQSVTITASLGTVLKNFTLQLNTAIPSLSVNATSVAFGDVVVNTSATQSVTLTSTGTAPVTINGATLTGAGFRLSGFPLPAALNPGQEATLYIEFDPAAVGTTTGQLSIATNASTNGTALIGLSGTGTTPPGMAVAVTPTIASTTTGATQQFVASVTGSSDTSVTWMVSGSGCGGTACGTISSSGLYTAPAAVPSSASVIITAMSQSDLTKSASAHVTIVPPQAAGYNLVWEDTFSTLSLCTTNVPGCNWYNPGLWWETAAGTITDPSEAYVNLDWASGQANPTNISTASPNGTNYRAWHSGYFEVRMKFSPTTGSSPAIWMMPEEENQPSTITNGMDFGELDIFEWQSNTPTTGYATAHVWLGNSGAYEISNNNTDHAWTAPAGTNFADYNSYGVLLTSTSIKWYFNNILVKTLDTTTTPWNAAYSGTLSYSLILSQQAGCNWTSICMGQVSPLDMQIQWVHVYGSP
jgi:beta-glucanase (GH16 family)